MNRVAASLTDHFACVYFFLIYLFTYLVSESGGTYCPLEEARVSKLPDDISFFFLSFFCGTVDFRMPGRDGFCELVRWRVKTEPRIAVFRSLFLR